MMLRHSEWSASEVEATTASYFEMLHLELAGVPFNKAEQRRALLPLLDDRSEAAIEFKHCNISAVLIELGQPYIEGYQPRFNYQAALFDAVQNRVASDSALQAVISANSEHTPELSLTVDILSAKEEPPVSAPAGEVRALGQRPRTGRFLDHLALEGRNRALGLRGEEFVVAFEVARLRHVGASKLADRVNHVARTQGDGLGYDILSFEHSGAPRYIEVKTTKYGKCVPFAVTRNELEVSQEAAEAYHLYRVFSYRVAPRLFTLTGPLDRTCRLFASEYVGRVA